MTPKELIQHLSNLSKIKVSDKIFENILSSFDNILSYVKSVEKIVASEESDINVYRISATKNVFRDDVATNKSGEYTEKLLSQVKQRDGNWVKVSTYDFVSKK